jgi:hypothetical protein
MCTKNFAFHIQKKYDYKRLFGISLFLQKYIFCFIIFFMIFTAATNCNLYYGLTLDP